MSVPVNYYLSVARGKSTGIGAVTANTSTQGTSADVEVRLQIDNGTGLTKLTDLDVKLCLEAILAYLSSNGVSGGGTAGANLPKL